jgi:hypothetical protein
MDYTFNNINALSLPIAPYHTMQFGSSLLRILQQLAYANPTYGLSLMAKLDLANGYYRIPLNATAALELAVVLPPDGTDEPLIGLPLSLPMGWGLSPPYFCAFMETCADLANTVSVLQPTHQFDAVLQVQPDNIETSYHHTVLLPYNNDPPRHPLAQVDVYLYDFMVLAQTLVYTTTMQSLLHHINSVFVDVDNCPRKAVISQSKIDKGDATFSTRKCLLGWDVNTEHMNISLPEHWKERLQKLLHTFMARNYVSIQKWQCLLGELRSMAMALHSTKYLFSILQHALKKPTAHHIHLSALTKQALADWHILLNATPVLIVTLVPHAPHYYAAADALSARMGGFWMPMTLTTDNQPYIWRYPFHKTIRQHLVSFTNPDGDVTNSDLELAAFITCHSTLLCHIPSHPYTTTCIATDNTPTLAWVSKGSTTSVGPPVFLLRHLALDCRSSLAHVQPVFTPGNTNTSADLLSRSFHLSDPDMLQLVQQRFPTQPPWQLVIPPNDKISSMNLALSKTLQPWASPMAEPLPPTPAGTYGRPSATTCHATPSYDPLMTPYRSYKFSLQDNAWEPWLPPTLQSNLGRWKAPYIPWGRPWLSWVCQTPASSLQAN